jgi:hypothetical protein
MFPDSQPASSAVRAEFLSPDDYPRVKTVDREQGGIALNDPSGGLNVHVWRVNAEAGGIRLTNEDTAFTTILLPGIVATEVALAFDQNMRPTIAYVSDGTAYLYWFDALAGAPVTTSIGSGVTQPMLSLDDKRPELLDTSDIILAYIRGSTAYWRAQRDRFGVERLAGELPSGAESINFHGFGMTKVGRVQFYIRCVV